MQNSGSLVPLGRIGSSASKSDSAGRPRMRRLASCSTVGASNRLRMLISASMLARMRLISLMASSECPPRSKKLSSMLTRATPRISANKPQRISSCGVRGARRAWTGRASGAGSARRSSLPFARQRQFVHLDDRLGHHVVRQAAAQIFAQRCRRNVPADRHGIGHELLHPRHVLANDNRGTRDTALAQQCRLDLARLDPEPAQLHLRVGASHKLQHPIAAPPRQVPGPVHPSPEPPCGSATKLCAVKAARPR